MSKLFLIGFGLPKKLEEEINSLKKLVVSECGNQDLVDDITHCTLLINRFDNFDFLDKELKKACSFLPIIEVSIGGIGSFDDKVIFVKVLKSDALGFMQEKIANVAAPFHEGEHVRESQPKRDFSKDEILCSEKYGFPYVGKCWIPHLTVSALQKNCFSKVGKVLLEHQIKHKFTIKNIILYEWKNGWTPIGVYDLRAS